MIAADRAGLDQPHVEVGPPLRERQRREPARKPAADDGDVAGNGFGHGHAADLASKTRSGYRFPMHAAPLITPATPDDAKPVAAIYAHHVAHGTATYDIEPRSALATAGLISEHRAKGWPFLIARGADGAVAGYAYASQFRDRPAYAWACEDSIYIDPAHQGRGIGRALLEALLVAAEAAGFRTMIAFRFHRSRLKQARIASSGPMALTVPSAMPKSIGKSTAANFRNSTAPPNMRRVRSASSPIHRPAP